MTYIRGDKPQFDTWELLGNKGWNWANLLPYYKKSENYTIPTATQLAAGATYERHNHGFRGPVHVGHNSELVNSSTAPIVMETWESFSLSHNPDLNGGSVRGFAMGPQTLDVEQDKRWDAATAYYTPVERRRNLKIIQGTVKRITWANGKRKLSKHDEPRVVANGVEYITADGKKKILKARKEVVVSAGAARSPLVLEGSGIGNPRYAAYFKYHSKI